MGPPPTRRYGSELEGGSKTICSKVCLPRDFLFSNKYALAERLTHINPRYMHLVSKSEEDSSSYERLLLLAIFASYIVMPVTHHSLNMPTVQASKLHLAYWANPAACKFQVEVLQRHHEDHTPVRYTIYTILTS
jgi:hypothetical protein